MKLLPIIFVVSFIFSFFLIPHLVVAQTITAINSGNWGNAGTWSGGAVPDDNDVILIPAGKVVTVNGTDQTLNESILIVEGELIMDSPNEVMMDYSSLTFTGSSSGVIVEDGGKVTDGTEFGGSTHFIEVQGVKYWSGDFLCGANCGSTTGDYTSNGETGMPASMVNPLPVEMLYFRATHQKDKVLLEWATATEFNTSHFEIERSENGMQFTKLGEIPGAEKSMSTITYSFQDEDLPYQKFQKLYYRLKQVDFDGHYKYLEIITVSQNYSQQHELLVSPNPFTERISVDIKLFSQENLTVKVYDIKGQIRLVQSWTISENNNKIEINGAAGLPSGIYFLELTSNSISIREKIIKS